MGRQSYQRLKVLVGMASEGWLLAVIIGTPRGMNEEAELSESMALCCACSLATGSPSSGIIFFVILVTCIFSLPPCYFFLFLLSFLSLRINIRLIFLQITRSFRWQHSFSRTRTHPTIDTISHYLTLLFKCPSVRENLEIKEKSGSFVGQGKSGIWKKTG